MSIMNQPKDCSEDNPSTRYPGNIVSLQYAKAAADRLASLENDSATVMTASHQEQKSEQTFSNISPPYSSTA